MKLEVDIYIKLTEYDLDIHFSTTEDGFGLMGASGSGKSMILKCIAGIQTPDQGRIVLNDQVLFDSEKKIDLPPQRRHVGYLFQNYALFENMNVKQNIGAPLRAKHLPKDEIEKKVNEIMKDFHIENLALRYPRALSGGQKQRVALARLLVYDTNLVLLDEPFSALDEKLKGQLLLETKNKLTNYHKSFIFVSHSPKEMEAMVRNIKRIERGKLK